MPLKFEEDITVELLVAYQAKWHKSCYLKSNDNKLQRERKRESNRKYRWWEYNTETISCTTPIPGKQQMHFLHKRCCHGSTTLVQIIDADDNVRRMATDLQDTELLAKISGGDLTAIEAKYHLACLTSLRNKHCSYLRQN